MQNTDNDFIDHHFGWILLLSKWSQRNNNSLQNCNRRLGSSSLNSLTVAICRGFRFVFELHYGVQIVHFDDTSEWGAVGLYPRATTI